MTSRVDPPQGATVSRRQRSIYLDALRAVALCRVVVFHAFSAQWITLFTAMPMMFFIAGSLYAASLERRRSLLVIRDRYRRILFPYWLYIAIMIGLWASLGVLGEITPFNWVGILFPVLSPGGPQGPGLDTPLELTWIALWYLQFHLILSLVGPWLRRAQQRHATAMWITLGTLFGLSIVAGIGLAVVVFYVACWVLGYHQHDGHLETVVQRRWPPIVAVTGPLGLVLFLAFEGSVEWSGVALRLASVGAALLGVFWLTLAMGLRPRLEPLLHGFRTRSTVHWFSQRSLTIYMWHLVAIYAAVTLELPGTSSPAGVLAWTIVLTVAVVPVVGWAEDIAARRRPILWPRLPAGSRTVS